MEFLEIDGSFGEGGGQILRTALTFAVITNQPVRVSNVRAGRSPSGLRRQHVSSLKVLGEIFDSVLTGVKEGSMEISFVPGPPRVGHIVLDMKTAASITLVLQAVVPAVALARSRLELDLVGGTDVPWSPTFDYFNTIVRRAFAAAGISFFARAFKRGYYPRGGGRVNVIVEPCPHIFPLKLDKSPHVSVVDLVSRCGMLPKSVAERQLTSASSVLQAAGLEVGKTEVTAEQTDSPGSSTLSSTTGESFFIGSDELGARGKPAEQVGRAAGERFVAYVRSGACVDDNLADMIAPLLSLAPEPSVLRVARVSKHLDSGFHIARLFTHCEYDVQPDGDAMVVKVRPK